MRTRAKFVVEYKSNRRLTKAQPSSIWGNLDLKAVARQLEADNGLPAAVPAELPGEGPQALSSVTALAAETGRADQLPACSAVLSQAQSEPVATEQSAPPEDPVAEEHTTGKAEKEIKPKPRPRRVRQNPRSKHQAAPAAPDQDVIPDELAALEAENRQLKRLMIAKLRKENTVLTSMLGRFS